MNRTAEFLQEILELQKHLFKASNIHFQPLFLFYNFPKNINCTGCAGRCRPSICRTWHGQKNVQKKPLYYAGHTTIND